MRKSIKIFSDIIDRMERLNLSRSDMCRISDVPSITIHRWFNGSYITARESSIKRLDQALTKYEKKIYFYLKERFNND